jgi:rhodanese-related sulfurtransferase
MKKVAEARQTIDEISWESLENQTDSCVLIDVREPTEFSSGSVEGAINIPRGMLEFHIQNCPELKGLNESSVLEAPLILFCATGGRAALATQSLQALGFSNVCSIAGGLKMRS